MRPGRRTPRSTPPATACRRPSCWSASRSRWCGPTCPAAATRSSGRCPSAFSVGDLSGLVHRCTRWSTTRLMTLFFFLVGLEVKRELTIGELTDRSRADVPMVAALAGLIVPARDLRAVHRSDAGSGAWGVVISTDTAFLLGALALIGPKFPVTAADLPAHAGRRRRHRRAPGHRHLLQRGLSVIPLLAAIVLMVLLAARALPSRRPRPQLRRCSAPHCGSRCCWPASIPPSPASPSPCSSRSSRRAARDVERTAELLPGVPRVARTRRTRPR